jgi:pimeloyl-ACP methyl ester carboxylesterase
LLAEQARPGTFAALYCYEPIVLPTATPGRPVLDNPMSRAAGRRRERFASREEARAHFAAKPPLDALDPAVLAAYVTHGFRTTDDGGVTLACRPHHEALIYANGLAHDAWAHLGEVGCPVTVAHGAGSEVMGPDQARALAARLPRGRARTLPGLDHFGPLQNPAQVARAVLDDLVPTWSP